MNIRFPSEHMDHNPTKVLDCLDSIPDACKIPFLKKVVLWLESNGASWTSQRLKALRERAIALRAGQKPPTTSEWFMLTSSKKLKGYLSFIDKIATGNDKNQFRELIQLLSVFTSFKHQEGASLKDFQKMYNAMSHRFDGIIEDPFPAKAVQRPDLHRMLKNAWLKGKLGSRLVRAHLEVSGLDWYHEVFVELINSNVALKEHLSVLNNYTVTSAAVIHAFDLVLNERMRSNPKLPPRAVHKESLFLKGTYGLELPCFHKEHVPRGMGHVRYRVQPNGKVRFYAAPYPVVQEFLKPLGDFVYSLLRLLPWDCTFDQRAGVTKVQQWLKDGKSCSSIDLTSATDIFPLEFQVRALADVVGVCRPFIHAYIPLLRRHLEIFEYVSRGEWLLPSDMCEALGLPHGSTHRWKTGQPLGTYPSFGIFAIGHAALVLKACAEVGVSADEARSCFVILGDDIVINRDDVAIQYRENLRSLGVAVSEGKTLMATTRLAEFAGMLIEKDQAFYKPKYLPLTDQTVISLCDTFGPKVVKRMTHFQRALVSLPRPIGREVNPDGHPLSKRVYWALCLEGEDVEKRRILGPSDSLRRKMELDACSDRPDLNQYEELPRVTDHFGFNPGNADSSFFSRNHELRRIWRSFPPFVKPKETNFRYSPYVPSSWMRTARTILPLK